MYISPVQNEVYFDWVDQLDAPIAPSLQLPKKGWLQPWLFTKD